MEFSSAPVNIDAFSTIACLFVLSALVQFGKIVVVWVLSFVVGASLVIFVIDRRRLSIVVPFPLWVACQTVLHHSLCAQQDFSCGHARCERAQSRHLSLCGQQAFYCGQTLCERA